MQRIADRGTEERAEREENKEFDFMGLTGPISFSSGRQGAAGYGVELAVGGVVANGGVISGSVGIVSLKKTAPIASMSTV